MELLFEGLMFQFDHLEVLYLLLEAQLDRCTDSLSHSQRHISFFDHIFVVCGSIWTFIAVLPLRI